MAHAGMPPMRVRAVERAPGVYDAALDLTMAGDWVLLVDVTLAGGRRVAHRIDLARVRSAP
jgi:hypothetical protein